MAVLICSESGSFSVGLLVELGVDVGTVGCSAEMVGMVVVSGSTETFLDCFLEVTCSGCQLSGVGSLVVDLFLL